MNVSTSILQIESKDMLVGDIIRLEEDHEVPCDAVVLSTSDANGLCYIQVCGASATIRKWLKFSARYTTRTKATKEHVLHVWLYSRLRFYYSD